MGGKVTYVGRYTFRNYYDMPIEFQRRICNCDMFIFGQPFNGMCKKCGKPPSWELYQCINCDTIFIRDFSWPWFCAVDPTCWDCCQSLDSPCSIHGMPRAFINKPLPISLPMGLNPKIFSQEDLDSVFDFD